MLLMIDNYDSFTYNLVQYFGELGEEVEVIRNDAIDLPGRALELVQGLVDAAGDARVSSEADASDSGLEALAARDVDGRR